MIVPEETAEPPESTADSAVENNDGASPVSPAPPPTAGLSERSMVSGRSGARGGLLQENNPLPCTVGVVGDQEAFDVDMGEEASERDREMAAITKHHLALVIHAQVCSECLCRSILACFVVHGYC